MQLFNPTFEDVRIQYDSKVYKIDKQKSLEIPPWPESLAQNLIERTRKYGICLITDKMTPEEAEKAKREALKIYLEGAISERIANYNSYNDSMKNSGKTVEEDYTLLKAKRWKKEIAQLINYEEEKLGEESFLDFIPKKENKSEKGKAA